MRRREAAHIRLPGTWRLAITGHREVRSVGCFTEANASQHSGRAAPAQPRGPDGLDARLCDNADRLTRGAVMRMVDQGEEEL